MIVKLLPEHHVKFLSLKGGYRDSSESTLVKMSNCWKSHVTAHLCFRNCISQHFAMNEIKVLISRIVNR